MSCRIISWARFTSTVPVFGSANIWRIVGLILLPSNISYNSSLLTSKPSSSYSWFIICSITICCQVFSLSIDCCSSFRAETPFIILTISSFLSTLFWKSVIDMASPAISPTWLRERLNILAPELNASPTIKATSAKPITILTSNPPRFLMFCNVAIYFGFFNFYAIF